MPQTNKSKHRMKDGSIKKIKRVWDPMHSAAGHHKQEFGEPSDTGHRLHKVHKTPLRGKILVEHVEGPPKYEIREDGAKVIVGGAITHGPEFKLTYEDGTSVQVLDADTVKEYLKLAGKKVR